MKCARCADVGGFARNHLERPWAADKPNGCTCGAGAPCPNCNALHGDKPRLPEEFEIEVAREPNIIDLVERAGRKRWDK